MNQQSVARQLTALPVGSVVTLTSRDQSFAWSWQKINSEVVPGTHAWVPIANGSEARSDYLAGQIERLASSYEISQDQQERQ